MKGSSEEAVKKMIPQDMLANAKIEKVDKLTATEIENMHKDKK